MMDRSILVVDDYHHSAEVLASLLDSEGYRVRCAYDGHAALHEIEQDPPDLVISDIMMPKLDGVTLANRLRAAGWTIPVVLVSAEYAAVDVPGVVFMPKPLDLDDLLRVVRRFIAPHAAEPSHDTLVSAEASRRPRA
jgi:two-component system response regulator MprA